jgi:hypothetical protein
MKFRKQRKLLLQAAPTQIAHHLKHQPERSVLTRRDQRKRPRRRSLLQSRKSRNPRRRLNPLPILILIHQKPSQLKRDQELPQTFLLPAKTLTRQRKPLKKLLFHKRKLRLSLPPILIPRNLPSQSPRKLLPRKLNHPDLIPDLTPLKRSQPRKLPRKPNHLDLTPDLMIKKRLRLRPLQLLLKMPLPSVMNTMVNSNSSFKVSLSIPMRTNLENSSKFTEKCLNANSLWAWEDQREKLSLSTPPTLMPERHSTVPTKKTSMVELSGLSSVDKLLEDINHKVALMEHQPVRQTLFSLETLDSELNNGPSKNSSRVAETSTELELLWVKTVDQEVSLTSNLIATLLLSKP